MNQTKIKINDIDEFCKLFRVNIPVKEDFDYYVDTLRNSEEFKKILSEETLAKFSDFEQSLEKNGTNIYKYKLQCLDILKDYIVQTEAYKKMMESDLPKTKVESRDWTNQVEDCQFMVSLDFKSANYSILKSLDYKDELKENWDALCQTLGVHEVLASSKSFRQLVFGNTSPKRLQTLQQQKIIQLFEYLKGVCNIEDEKFIFLSHDELIFKVDDAEKARHIKEHVLKQLENLVQMSIRLTPFSTVKIKKNVFIKTLYNIEMDFNDIGLYAFFEQYKALHGVPGNKFYMYFKQHILNQPFDERDLIYFNDGELCKWVVQEEKPKKVQLPHYEKPDRILSIESAKVSYPRLWNQMTLLLPNMSNEEKRRAIEIVANTCKYCYEEPSGCQCWNDD